MHTPTRTLSSGPSPAQPLINLALSLIAPIYVIKCGWRTMGLRAAFFVHLFGIGVGFLGISIVSWFFTDQLLFANAIEDIRHADSTQLAGIFASLAFTEIVFEMAVLVLAWVLMPWGASPEPWRDSMNRGLIRLWQLTPFMAVCLTGLVFSMYLLDHLSVSYFTLYPDRHPTWLSWEMGQFLRALCWLIYFPSQLLVMFWAVSVHRAAPTWPAAVPWPAHCGECGYPLVMLGRGASCPECGTSATDSLDSPRNRPDPRGVLVRMFQATTRPYAFGRSIPLYRHDPGYRKALWMGTAMLVATVPIGMLFMATTFFIYYGDWELAFQDYGEVTIMFTVLTCLTLGFGLLLGLAGAAIWGAHARAAHGRYALYPAAQAFAYQSGFLSIWALGFYSLMLIVAFIVNRMDRVNHSSSLSWIDVLPLVFPAYFLLMLAIGFILQGRFLRGARFGNG